MVLHVVQVCRDLGWQEGALQGSKNDLTNPIQTDVQVCCQLGWQRGALRGDHGGLDHGEQIVALAQTLEPAHTGQSRWQALGKALGLAAIYADRRLHRRVCAWQQQ